MEIKKKLKTLLIMAAADGGLSDEELLLLSDRAAHWGISVSEFNDVVSQAADGNIDMEFPRNRQERTELLVDVVRMMGADGVMHEHEKQLFALIAAKMELGESGVNKIIDSALQSGEQET